MKSNRSDLILEVAEGKHLPLERWFDELIWCPSQCYYHIQHIEADYILYLRWRWEDPWQAHVVKNAACLDDMHKGNATWSEDVFLLNHISFRDEELDSAKAKLIDLFNRENGEFPERALQSQKHSSAKSLKIRKIHG